MKDKKYYCEDEFLRLSSVASNTDATGYAAKTPISDFEADNLSELMNVPARKNTEAKKRKKANKK